MVVGNIECKTDRTQMVGDTICIFESDLVWQMKLMIIKGLILQRNKSVFYHRELKSWG